MKIFVSILFSYLLGAYIIAQSLEPEVVASSGDQLENDQFGSLDWTLGEIMVEYYQSQEYDLEQGFHHLDSIVIVSIDPIASKYEIHIFPNPTSQWLKIETTQNAIIHAHLYGTNGKTIQKHLFRKSIHLDLSNLPAGVYLLQLSDGVTTPQTYRVVKVKA